MGWAVKTETDGLTAIRFNNQSVTNRITKGKDSIAVGYRLGAVSLTAENQPPQGGLKPALFGLASCIMPHPRIGSMVLRDRHVESAIYGTHTADLYLPS